MKTIFAGPRKLYNEQWVEEAAQECGWEITEWVSGHAEGIDKCGEVVAGKLGIPLKIFPANWKLHGKAAGPIRNVEMAVYADALVAIWDGISRGTGHMIETAKKKGLKVYVKIVTPEKEVLDSE